MGSPEAQTIGPGVMSVGEPRIPAPCVTLGSIPTPLCFLVIFRQMSCECPCLEPGEAYRDNEVKDLSAWHEVGARTHLVFCWC